MATLDARLSALETGDSHWTIVRPAPSRVFCGRLARAMMAPLA